MKKPIDIDALVAEAVPPRPNPQLAFTMPVRVDSETNAREHWAKKRNRKINQKIATRYGWVDAVRPIDFRVSLPCVVRLVRVGSRKLDSDNLGESFKAIRDALAGMIGVDDGDERIKWEYAQVAVGKRVYQVRVEVY
jgi:hypothetical protein